MRAKGRYNEVLFIADTCQASTLGAQVRSPGVLAVGSSEKGENSYSHHHDFSVGLSVIDRFTYHTLEFMEKVEPHSRATAKEWFEQLTFPKLRSHAKPQTGNYARRLEETRVVDFFGSVTRATPVHHAHYDVRGGAKRAPGVAPPRFDPAEEGYRPEGVRVTSIEEAFRGGGGGRASRGERFRGDPRGGARRRRRRPRAPPPSSRGDDATSKERRRPRTEDEKTHEQSHVAHTHTRNWKRRVDSYPRARREGVCFWRRRKNAANQPHATRPRSNARSAASDASAASVASRRRSPSFPRRA